MCLLLCFDVWLLPMILCVGWMCIYMWYQINTAYVCMSSLPHHTCTDCSQTHMSMYVYMNAFWSFLMLAFKRCWLELTVCLIYYILFCNPLSMTFSLFPFHANPEIYDEGTLVCICACVVVFSPLLHVHAVCIFVCVGFLPDTEVQSLLTNLQHMFS